MTHAMRPISRTVAITVYAVLLVILHWSTCAALDENQPSASEGIGQQHSESETGKGVVAEQAPAIVPLDVPSAPRRVPGSESRPRDEQGRRRYFYVQRPRLGLGLAYEFEEERRKGPDIDTKDTTREFRERITAQTRGWVYHPSLMKYTLRVQPEFSQSKEKRDPGENFSDNAFLPAYFADATFLEKKPYSLYLFGSRRETTVRSAFAQSSDTQIDSYGGDLRFKNTLLPTTLGYEHVEIDQSGFFDRDEDRDDFRLTSRHLTRRSITSLNATYSDSDQSNNGVTTNLKTTNSTLQNNFDITGKRNLSLTSILTYRSSETDTLDSSGLRLNERLNWRHAPNLRTDYDFSYEKTESGDFDNETTAIGARLTHLLYENLTTTIEGEAFHSDFTDGEETGYRPGLDFLYQRKIPWGVLTLNSGWDYRVTLREGGESTIQVFNEAQVLTTGQITLLDNINVDQDSVFVTDLTGTIVYTENVDYTLEEVDAFTRISRTTFGAIANGQTVLVDYRFLSEPAFDDAVFSQNYGFQLFLWSSLLFSYNFQKADQEILSGPTPENTIDDTAQRVELQYDVRWSNTRLTFEDIDRSSGVSSRQWLAEETLRFRPLSSLFFSLRGYYGRTEFNDGDETEKRYGARSIIEWRPTRWSNFSFDGFSEKVSGDVDDTVTTGFNAIFRMSYRIWSGNIIYGYSNEEDQNSGQERTQNSLLIEAIRAVW